MVELGKELFGARLCTGTVEAILQRAARALEDPYGDLAERVRSSASLNMDETGWRTAGERRASPPTGTRIAPRACLPIPGQRRSLFAYTSELLATHARGDPVPLLA